MSMLEQALKSGELSFDGLTGKLSFRSPLKLVGTEEERLAEDITEAAEWVMIRAMRKAAAGRARRFDPNAVIRKITRSLYQVILREVQGAGLMG